VYAIEEVSKYAETTAYLAHAFGVDSRVVVKPLSIYACNNDEFWGRFNIVYFPGVIYHLSDPLIALRILFNSLKLGGSILIESAGIDLEEPYCRFDGSLIHRHGDKRNLNRGGWNWFMPSPSALARMMSEAGFEEVQSLWDNRSKRVYAYGKKISQVGICRAGLSVPDIM
ncbi:MAG: DUF1698 domain-containing protein, partial [Anaerolineae bacterium]|nr:DUF1698 domain-containing protein [Anaerolineae bacterium]